MSEKIVLKNVRIAFPELFVPVAFKGDANAKKRYGCALLLPKDHPQLKDLEAELMEAATNGWPKNPAAALASHKAKGDTCLSDGDADMAGTFAGYWKLSAHRAEKQLAPKVFGRDPKAGTLREGDPGTPYGGCWVNTSVSIWAQTKDYPGIRCTLLAVQFLRDGEAFVTQGSPDDFDEIEDGADADSFM